MRAVVSRQRPMVPSGCFNPTPQHDVLQWVSRVKAHPHVAGDMPSRQEAACTRGQEGKSVLAHVYHRLPNHMCCMCRIHVVHVLKTGALSKVLPVSCTRKEAMHIVDVETLLLPDECILATITRPHACVAALYRGTSCAAPTVSCAL